MRYPYPTARESRTIYACFGVSLAVHALAMFALPGLRTGQPAEETRPLVAFFASSAASANAFVPAPAARRPQERHPLEPVKTVEPVPASAPEPAPGPSAAPAAPPVAAIPAETAPAAAPATAAPEVADASLLEAYRLALIDAAKRYKRYPMQAMERGWEGRVEIRVVVGANGMIKSALVKRSSRYQILDDQALDMVRRAFNALAQDRPAPRGREFTVDVPVIFELQTG